MKTIPSTTSLIGLKVYHGSPGYENEEVIEDMVWKKDRASIEFESGCTTNMTETELDIFMEHGEVMYKQHFASPADWGYSSLHLI